MKTSLGIFWLGTENIQLFVTDDDDCGVFFGPDQKSLPRLHVTVDTDSWPECLDGAIHEATELLLLRSDAAYKSVMQTTGDLSNRLFIFNHGQFTQICGRLAGFLVEVAPEIALAFNKFQKMKGKK